MNIFVYGPINTVKNNIKYCRKGKYGADNDVLCVADRRFQLPVFNFDHPKGSAVLYTARI